MKRKNLLQKFFGRSVDDPDDWVCQIYSPTFKKKRTWPYVLIAVVLSVATLLAVNRCSELQIRVSMLEAPLKDETYSDVTRVGSAMIVWNGSEVVKIVDIEMPGKAKKEVICPRVEKNRPCVGDFGN